MEVDPTVVLDLDVPGVRNLPLTVIVDHNGGVNLHVAVKSNEYDQVNGYDQGHEYAKIYAGQ